MRYGSHLFLRVEPSLPAAVTAAAKAAGTTRSEFIRRAVRQALPVRARTAPNDRDPPPSAPSGAAMPAAA